MYHVKDVFEQAGASEGRLSLGNILTQDPLYQQLKRQGEVLTQGTLGERLSAMESLGFVPREGKDPERYFKAEERNELFMVELPHDGFSLTVRRLLGPEKREEEVRARLSGDRHFEGWQERNLRPMPRRRGVGVIGYNAGGIVGMYEFNWRYTDTHRQRAQHKESRISVGNNLQGRVVLIGNFQSVPSAEGFTTLGIDAIMDL